MALTPTTPAPATTPAAWGAPATVATAIAIISALISLGGAIASWYSARVGNEIQRQTAQTQALTALSQQSETLQSDVERNGIGDVQKLTNFFISLGKTGKKE